MLRIFEIFGPVIQGEGIYAGAPALFVRLIGCDQEPPCVWCDTRDARRATSKLGIDMTEEAIIEELKKLAKGSNLKKFIIVLTGGNPCAQDCTELINQLRLYDVKIHVETQGSLIPDWLSLVDVVCFSPKPPSAGAYHSVKLEKKYGKYNGQSIESIAQFFQKELRRGTDPLDVNIKIVFFDLKADLLYALSSFFSISCAIEREIELQLSKDSSYKIPAIKYNFVLQIGTPVYSASSSAFEPDKFVEAIFDPENGPNELLTDVCNPEYGTVDLRILPQIHRCLGMR